MDRQISTAVSEDDPEDADDRPRPAKMPKRIARRRDTFCEVIDTPEKGDGSRAIKIKITTNKSKQSLDEAATLAVTPKNAKRPKLTKQDTPPDIPGRPVLSRECKVVLEKLDSDGLKRARNEIMYSSEEEDGAKTESTTPAAAATVAAARTPNRMDAKRLKRIYNVDKSMHSRSEPTTCALCSATPRFLVHHYVNEHFGYEVCHARMPPETTESLRDGGSTAAVHEQNKITALCHYCEKMRTFAAKDWVLHITRHTGEYMRVCNKCNLKCADNKFKSSAQCAHDDVGVWNDIEIKGNALGVFVCNQCNYSQLLEDNLQKHVRQMHSINKNPKNHYEFVELIPNMHKKRKRRTPAATATSATAVADNDSETSSSVGESEPANPNVFEPSEHGDGLIDTDTLQLMKETTFTESADDAPGPSQSAAKNMADKLSERFRKQDAISDPKPEIDNIDVAMECPEEGIGSSPSGRRRSPLQSDSPASAASAATSRTVATVAAKRQNKETTATRKGMANFAFNLSSRDNSTIEKLPFSAAAAAVNARLNVNENNSGNSESDENGWESCTGSEDGDEDDGSVANESDSKNKMIASTLTRLYTKLGKSKAKPKKKVDPKRLTTSAEWKPLPVKVEKIKTEDDGNASMTVTRSADDPSKTVSMVENIAFSECKGLLEFICFVGNCCYRTTQLMGMLHHVREHDEKWSGTCLMCKEVVCDPKTPLALSKEVKHLEEQHVPKANVSNAAPTTGERDAPVLEPAVVATTPAPTAAAVVVRPMIKCRRVSGDRLSTLKSEETPPTSAQLQISQMPTPIPNIPAVFEFRNVSGNGCSGINDNPLKPWTKCPLSKSLHATQKLLRDASLIALFKCMGINCHFSTGDADKMLQHLQYHEDYVTTQQISTNEQLDHLSWLECCYCDTMVDTCNLLVQHIQMEHSASVYQCPYCFYRSAAIANVESHLNEYHVRKDKMIIQCLGPAKQLHAEIMIMLAGREKNVVPIQCGDEGT